MSAGVPFCSDATAAASVQNPVPRTLVGGGRTWWVRPSACASGQCAGGRRWDALRPHRVRTQWTGVLRARLRAIAFQGTVPEVGLETGEPGIDGGDVGADVVDLASPAMWPSLRLGLLEGHPSRSARFCGRPQAMECQSPAGRFHVCRDSVRRMYRWGLRGDAVPERRRCLLA